MPQILDPGSVRLSNADVLDWITAKNAQIKLDAAADRAASQPKSHLAANYARSLRKHSRELSSRKYPYADNPGAYLGPNRLRSLAVFAAKVDERVVFPAEEELRERMVAEGKGGEVVERAVRALWERKALTETEHLQVFNLAPSAVEMLANFLVDAEERFTQEEMGVLVEVVGEVYRCGERLPGVEGLEGLEGEGEGGEDGVESIPASSSYKQGAHNMPMAERNKAPPLIQEIQSQPHPEITKTKSSQKNGPPDISALAHIAKNGIAAEARKGQEAAVTTKQHSTEDCSSNTATPAPETSAPKPSTQHPTPSRLTKEQVEQERLASIARFETEATRIQEAAEAGVRARKDVGLGGGYSDVKTGYVGPKDANAEPLGKKKGGRGMKG